LKQSVEKALRERKIDAGRNWNETVDNYNVWKQNQEKLKRPA